MHQDRASQRLSPKIDFSSMCWLGQAPPVLRRSVSFRQQKNSNAKWRKERKSQWSTREWEKEAEDKGQKGEERVRDMIKQENEIHGLCNRIQERRPSVSNLF